MNTMKDVLHRTISQFLLMTTVLGLGLTYMNTLNTSPLWQNNDVVPLLSSSSHMHPLSTTPASPRKKFNSNVEFIFMIGLEGTGHHFMTQLFQYMPHLKREDLGDDFEGFHLWQQVRNKRSSNTTGLDPGLFNLQCDYFSEKNTLTKPAKVDYDVNTTQVYQRVVKALQRANNAQNTAAQKVKRIPLNTWKEGRGKNAPEGQISYPNYSGACKPIAYPNLDLLYLACDEAKVDCGHVYLYRDILDILHSTVEKRQFWNSLFSATNIFSSLLQVIMGQLTLHADRTYGCYPLEDPTKLDYWFQPFRKLWGWEDYSLEDYERFLSSVYVPPETTTTHPKQKHLPDQEFKQSVYIKTLVRLNEEAFKMCLQAVETYNPSYMSPPINDDGSDTTTWESLLEKFPAERS